MTSQCDVTSSSAESLASSASSAPQPSSCHRQVVSNSLTSPMRSSSANQQRLQHALRAASADNDVVELRRLLETARRQGDAVNVNVFDEAGQTPLHVACLAGDLALVRLLVEHFAANVQLATRDGWNALHLAAGLARADVLVYLADVTRAHKRCRTSSWDKPAAARGSKDAGKHGHHVFLCATDSPCSSPDRKYRKSV